MPSSITWMWPSSGLSGRPTSGADSLKSFTSTWTEMSVLVTLSPSLGDITASVPLVVGSAMLGWGLAAGAVAGALAAAWTELAALGLAAAEAAALGLAAGATLLGCAAADARVEEAGLAGAAAP